MDNFITPTPEMIKLATELSMVMAQNCREEWILCGIADSRLVYKLEKELSEANKKLQMVRDVVNPEPKKELNHFPDHAYDFGYYDREPLDITAHYIKNNHRTSNEFPNPHFKI